MVTDNIYSELIIKENDGPQIIEKFNEETDRKYLNKKCFKFKNKKPFRNKKPTILKPFKFYKDWNGVCIENAHYAGIIQLKNVRLRFYPKFNIRIFYMLSYLQTDEEFLYDPDKVIEIKEGVNFFDLIGRLFFIQLDKIIKTGLLKKYTEKYENLGYIKGKLSIKGQIKNEINHMPKFSCTYDDLTFDNLENRIILRALNIIIPVISIGELRKNLRRQEYAIRDFVELKTNITPRDCDKIRFNRLNDHYHIIIKLSKLILENNFVRSTKKGESKIFNFLVNTNTLYENFIIEMIKEVVKKEFNEYETKEKIFKGLFKDNKISVQPDMVLKVKGSESYPVIFDAKYKSEDSNLDYYEMIAYCLAVSGAKSCCLIYPKESGIDNNRHILSKLDEIEIHTSTIDLYGKENLELDDFIKEIKNRIKEIISIFIEEKKDIAQPIEKAKIEEKPKIDVQKKIVANYLENVTEEEKKIIKDYMTGKTLNKTYLTINGSGGSIINIKTGYNSRLPEHTKVIVMDISHDVWKKKIGEIHNYSEIIRVSDIPKLHTKDYRLWSKLGNCRIGNNYIGTKVIIDKNIAEHPIVLVDYELNWKTEKIPSLEEIPLLSESEMINHPDVIRGGTKNITEPKINTKDDHTIIQEHKIRTYIGVKIKSFQLRILGTGEWGKEYTCQFSQDVLPKLCKVLMDRHKDFDIYGLNKDLNNMYFFHGDGKGRNSKQIGDTNIYVETHHNNDRMVELCYQIIKLFGYSKNDLKINTT